MKQFPRIGLRYNNHYIRCYNIQNSVCQSPLVLINNSSSEDKTNIAKNDVMFQRCHMTQISPTPFDTHSMVKELCDSGMYICIYIYMYNYITLFDELILYTIAL